MNACGRFFFLPEWHWFAPDTVTSCNLQQQQQKTFSPLFQVNHPTSYECEVCPFCVKWLWHVIYHFFGKAVSWCGKANWLSFPFRCSTEKATTASTNNQSLRHRQKPYTDTHIQNELWLGGCLTGIAELIFVAAYEWAWWTPPWNGLPTAGWGWLAVMFWWKQMRDFVSFAWRKQFDLLSVLLLWWWCLTWSLKMLIEGWVLYQNGTHKFHLY